MKKLVPLFISCLFLTAFFILPYKVNALSYKSDYIDLNSKVDLRTDEFELSLYLTDIINQNNTRENSINCETNYKTDDTYYYHYIIYYYNEQKQEIGATDGYSMMEKTITTPEETFYTGFDSLLEQKYMYNTYKISEIKYYKLFIEPTTKTIAENYFNNKIKLNPNGIDEITDNNTIEVKSEIKQEEKPNVTNTTGNGEYAITKYNVDMTVNENNTFNISEDITTYFSISKHGIFRKIPLRNKVVRLDGTTSYNRAKISNINVNEEYTSYYESGNKVIKIGNPDYTLTGPKEYNISYLYNLGKDTGKDYDELYYNIIGTGWDTTISNVAFTIKMPKEFDKTKLGFSRGLSGSTDSSNITYDVVGNTITGKYNGVLNAGEALTVRLELPEGYFVGASNNFNPMIIILFVLPVVFAVISFLLWAKYGKDDKTIETVEFYPPEGFNSAEVGFLYKGQADKTDVVSLLIYLANKGYVRIEESEEKALFSTEKGFKIVKIKEYDGNNINEKVFLNGLFNLKESSITSELELIKYMKNPQEEVSKEDNSQSKLQEVTATDLYDNFYITLNAIVGNLNDKENKRKIFEKSTSGKSLAVILMTIVSVFTIVAIPTLEYAGIDDLGIVLLVTLFYVPFYAVAFTKNIPLTFRLFWGGFTIFHSSMFFIASPVKEAVFSDPVLLVGFIIGLTCIIAMIFCFKLMPKRTPYGNEILGKIKGFRTFLETAEKPKLEELVMQNPSYFYNILPFTYVLGVSDKWIKKFETISLQAPDWYGGNTAFSAASFGSFMDSTMSSASTAMSSSPSSGGGSGGGSSGGGSGGGGGGSW